MADVDSETQESKTASLEGLLLTKDYSKLSARIATYEHSVKCQNKNVNIRVHYPTFRQAKPTVEELIDTIIHYMVSFTLPRSKIKAVQDQYGKIPVDEYDLLQSRLKEEAKDLFKLAHRLNNRNGEAGELILYLLTEWQLGAPQILAKMSLKTNPAMPVHGADGVHAQFDATTKSLLFFWGEAKLHANLAGGLSAAASSIAQALQHDSIKHELQLVERFIDFSGMPTDAQAALLEYLDPLSEKSNKRINIMTCLLAFNFSAFADIQAKPHASAEGNFAIACDQVLEDFARSVTATLESHGIQNELIEIFLLPVPSVQDLRDKFQNKIGWYK